MKMKKKTLPIVFLLAAMILGNHVTDYQVYGGLHTFLAVNGNFVWIALSVFVLIFAASLFMWIAGSRKLKRNDAFLSYRTLRDALKEEKKNM